MSEEVKLRPEAPQTTGDIQATLEQADKFLSDMAPHLGKLFGISPSISVGRIAEDGDWGIILAQTSSMAGLKSLIRPEGFTNTRTPDEMAGKLTVAGQRVDGMGIFEYIALTLQEDPKTISNRDCSWLLANHLRVPGSANENKLPYGRWNEDSVVFGLLPDDYSSVLYQPRLAIVDTMPQSSIDLNDLLTGKTTINNKPLPKPPVMRATPPEKRLII